MLRGIFPGQIATPPARWTRDFLAAYSTMPWLRAVVGKISWSIASTQWNLYAVKRKGKFVKDAKLTRVLRAGNPTVRRQVLRDLQNRDELEPIEASPFYDVLDSANPYQVGLQLRQVEAAQTELVGESFLMKERNGLGILVNLWPIPPHWILSTPTPTYRYYRVSFRGWQDTIPETEIMWSTVPNPENPYGRGTGTAMATADELETDEYAAKHLRQWFFNKARPDLIITADGLDPTETKRMETDWLQRHQGFWRAFKPYFIGRDVKVHEIDQDFRSQQVVQLRQHERDIIISTWGVPPEILGIIENSNRATIDAADYLYAAHVLVPRLELKRSIYQERLVPEFDDRLVVDYVSPVGEDRAYALETRKAASWALRVNEWRKGMGLEPISKADGGENFMVPSLISPKESLEEAEPLNLGGPGLPGVPPVPGAPPAPGAGSEPPEDEPEPADKRITRAKALAMKGAIDRLADRMEPGLRQAFLAAVNAVKGSIDLEALANAVESGSADAVEVALAIRSLPAELQRMTPVLHDAFTKAGVLTAAELTQATGVTIGFDLVNPRAVEWASTHAAAMVREITAGQQQMIRDLVTNAQAGQGETVYTLAKKLRDVVGLLDAQAAAVDKFEARLIEQGVGGDALAKRVQRYANAQLAKRAETIARTEIQAASYQGQLESWQQGVEQGQLDPNRSKRVWLVHDDDRLDPIVCEPMDEQKREFAKPFTTGTGQSIMRPPAHPRCRCSMVLEFD